MGDRVDMYKCLVSSKKEKKCVDDDDRRNDEDEDVIAGVLYRTHESILPLQFCLTGQELPPAVVRRLDNSLIS